LPVKSSRLANLFWVYKAIRKVLKRPESDEVRALVDPWIARGRRQSGPSNAAAGARLNLAQQAGTSTTSPLKPILKRTQVFGARPTPAT